MRYLGIDPGQGGGVAVLSDRGVVHVEKMPQTERDIWELFVMLAIEPGLVAVIEKVHVMPKQGIVSAATFMRGYGGLRMALIGNRIPFNEVAPQQWQKAIGCLSRGDKNITKAKAQQMFPTVTPITHAIADALLIAEFCRRENAK